MNDTERPEPAADAVERVHKAICGALVMMGYSPIEFVVDGTMTAMARAALQAAAVEPAADAVDVDRLGSILRMEYARGYQDAKKEGQVRTFSSTTVNDAALRAAAVEPAADERGKFEEVFGPLPPDCIRVGEGYAATQYSAWQCQTYIQNWNGWKARAALQAAAVEPEPDAAIAAFESVLLSDEVVVAAGDVIAGEFYADLPMMTGEAYSQVAKAALQAALAAAKGTEGSA